PDFYAILDIPHDEERDCWRAWNEVPRFPDVIVEFTSKSSRHNDRVKKFAIYRDILAVPNYFICDIRRFTLDGFELCQREYTSLAPNDAGRLWCASLGLWIGWLDSWLRWFDRGGNLLPTGKE